MPLFFGLIKDQDRNRGNSGNVFNRNETDHELAVVIVNYKTARHVTNCLETLMADLDGVDTDVMVVDNKSDDGSCGTIQQWIKDNGAGHRVRVIQSDRNGGFSAGNNIGIKASNAKYYLLLNSDTLIRPGAVPVLLATARSEQRAGLISPRLEWPDGRAQESCFRFPNPLSEFSSATQTGFINNLFSRFLVVLPVEKECTRPPWTSFACVLVKNEVFQQLGLLDDRFFMYFEDVEFCYRMKSSGWEIVNQPGARVIHLRGGSSSVKEDMHRRKRLPRYYYESRTLYFYQAHGWPGLTIANLLWGAGRLISKFRQIAGRPDKAAIESQWRDIWINWLSPQAACTHPDSANQK